MNEKRHFSLKTMKVQSFFIHQLELYYKIR
jgi:hypothetical protein